MDFIDDPLNYYPDCDEELIPPENIYWMTNVPTHTHSVCSIL